MGIIIGWIRGQWGLSQKKYTIQGKQWRELNVNRKIRTALNIADESCSRPFAHIDMSNTNAFVARMHPLKAPDLTTTSKT